MSFTLRLFGGATLEGPDGPLTGRAAQRHRLGLLALLATAPGGGLTRDKLVAYLWPESDDERGRRLLSDSVYRIHRALGEGVVQSIGDALRLDAELLPSDVAAFGEALGRADWQGAIDLYAGPFLDGFHLPEAGEFERWLGAERGRLAQEYGRALERFADEKAAAGDRPGCVSLWRRRAAHDPYDSRVAVRLMEALEAAGNRAGALRHARIHEQLLDEEFGSVPAPEVLAMAERLRSGAAARRPDLPGGAPPRPDPTDRPPPASRAREVTASGDPGPGDAAPRDREPPATPPRAGPRPTRGRAVAAIGFLAAVGLTLLVLGLGWATRPDPDPGASTPAGIAVLPFATLDAADEESLFFADGLTEEVLTGLSRIPGLRVVARASIMPYRGTTEPIGQIAGDLGVSHLLQGSVRRSDEELRVAVQLVDVATNANIWAESYDRPLRDVFAVQSDIARRVADVLETRLTPGVAARIDRAPTDDLEAYNAYLRGRYYWHRRTEEDLAESARFFARALERDPGYAQAWVGLADAYAVQAFYDYRPPAEVYPEARHAANRALEIDENLPEAHASLGYITLYYDWDAPTAEAAFRRAIELNPSYSVGHQWYANLLVATARFDEAARSMSRAREVNPLSLIANGALGWVYYYAGRYEEAVEQCDLALEMDPGWDLGHLWRGLALEGLGRMDEAIGSLRRAVELSGGSGITVAALAHAQAVSGSPEEARALLDGLIAERARDGYEPPFEIAKVHVALGEYDEALRWLERAFEEHSHSMVFLEVDPQLAPLRGEPAFRRLVARVAVGG